MKISTLEQAMRAMLNGPWNPVPESLNGTGALNGPGLAEFAEAAKTLTKRSHPVGADPTTPLSWI